jgi:trk system potassium uptake protein TrkA
MKREVGVIGLGKFGFSLAQVLRDMGQDVVGVDLSDARIRQVQDTVSQVYHADATDKTVLEQLGFQHLEYVVVSIGHSMEASILITLNLKELGVEEVWVKALSDAHEKVLYKIGADLVVFPERFVATQLAHRLSVPGLMQYLPLGGNIVLQELTVDKWAGNTLRELDLTNRFGVQIVAVKPSGTRELSFIPGANTKLDTGDVVIVLGTEDKLGEM